MAIKGLFKVDVFDCIVHIVISDNIKQSINYHLKKFDQELLGCNDHPAAYFCRPNPDRIGNYYVYFSHRWLDTVHINHEKSHLCEQILIDRSIKPKDEVRAYLEGFISQKLDAFFRKHKLKIQNKAK